MPTKFINYIIYVVIMIEVISRVRGNNRKYVEIPKEKADLLNNGDAVKITKINEDDKNEDSFRDWYR